MTACRPALPLLLLAAALPARAHHGTASAGATGAEGPGAALETASALPLGQGTAVALLKAEVVPFERREGFAEPKRFASFHTAVLGLGLRPWLSAFLFQPYNWKSQEVLGTNRGPGDTSLMLALASKWDEGLRLVPERESLDDLEDWHFSLQVAATLPVGPTDHRGAGGRPFAPDMQTGFGAPSATLGLAALKQLSADLTLLLETNVQAFFPHRYATEGIRYAFGDEARLQGAAAWRAWAGGWARLDLCAELSGLWLRRDRSDAGTGSLEPLQGSGGAVLYGELGARATLGPFALGLGVKRALARRLNEPSLQQGSEGLEVLRAVLTAGYAARL